MEEIVDINPENKAADNYKKADDRTNGRQLSLMSIVGVPCFVFFSLTSPRMLPSVVLIAGFVLVGCLLFVVLHALLILTGAVRHMSRKLKRALLVTGTVLPVLTLMLQSLGQLTVRDILTLTSLFIISVFYMARIGKSGRVQY